MPQKASTSSQVMMKRLKSNLPAKISCWVILFFVMVAIFAYFIAPDHSPYADLQTVEIQAKPAGYEQQFLRIPKENSIRTNYVRQLIAGKPSAYTFIPIHSYSQSGDQLLVQKYVDDVTSVPQTFSINTLTHNNPASIKEYVVTKKYILGTDLFGRDILSRLIIGTRVSLSVGLIAVLISLLIGILAGALAGYYRGRIDAIIMWLVNVTWSIPTLLLVFAFTIAMGKGFWQIFIAVGLTLWVSVARLVRGQVMALRELEYVQAAKVLGFSNARIICKHILPNMMGPLMVIAAGNFATAIMLEAGLSFLGIGVQPPQPSWGLMMKEHYNFIITNKPMLAIIPGIAIMILVLAFNLLGNGLRDAMDVRATAT